MECVAFLIIAAGPVKKGRIEIEDLSTAPGKGDQEAGGLLPEIQGIHPVYRNDLMQQIGCELFIPFKVAGQIQPAVNKPGSDREAPVKGIVPLEERMIVSHSGNDSTEFKKDIAIR